MNNTKKIIPFLFLIACLSCATQYIDSSRKVTSSEKRKALTTINNWLDKNKDSVGISKINSKRLKFSPEEGYLELTDSISIYSETNNLERLAVVKKEILEHCSYVQTHEYISFINSNESKIDFWFNDEIELLIVEVFDKKQVKRVFYQEVKN